MLIDRAHTDLLCQSPAWLRIKTLVREAMFVARIGISAYHAVSRARAVYLAPLLSVGDEVVRIWQARVAQLTQARDMIGAEYTISATEICIKVLDGACPNYARACVC